MNTHYKATEDLFFEEADIVQPPEQSKYAFHLK